MEKIGWIGLGTMGSRMASNLALSGHPVTAWNRTVDSEGAQAAKASGCAVVGSIAEVVQSSEIIFLSVGDEHDVEKILFGDGGAINPSQARKIIVDTSTIPPESAKHFNNCAWRQGFSYLDCPVSGGDTGAANRTLVAMIGGDTQTVEKVTPILSELCKAVHHCGPAGSGQAVKLCNQILCAVHMVGLCEAIEAARTLGIDPRSVIEVCSGGAADSWALRNLGPRIMAGNLTEGFRIGHMRKDLRIVKQSVKRNLPGVDLADGLFDRASDIAEGYLATQGMVLAYGAADF